VGRIASVRIAWLPSGEAEAGEGETGEGALQDPDTGPGLRSPAGSGDSAVPAARRLAVALLEASPRVMVAAPDLCRVDARGWGRRGGEVALARALHEAAGRTGARVGVGIADGSVAADAAAGLAVAVDAGVFPLARRGGGDREPGPVPGRTRTRIVAPGGSRAFLAALPLSLLGLPEDMTETLRVLGFRTAGELAARRREELEARFGPAGIRAHRRASGEDDELFRPVMPADPPEASVELEAGVRDVEPLLFVLGPLLDRLCGEVGGTGWSIRRLVLRMELEGGGRREVVARPARPTLRRDLLHELCRAGLERSAVARGERGEGRLPAPVVGLAVRAAGRAAPAVRQEDLFRDRIRDPVPATAALSRIRARLGEDVVVAPSPVRDHRPERRSGWRPVSPPGDGATAPDEVTARGGEEGSRGGGTTITEGGGLAGEMADGSVAGVLRLLPEPRPVEVRWEGGRPAAVWDDAGRHDIVAAEGPERLSGDWWRDPYRREYYRVCTAGRELLWLFREYRHDGTLRWWLHGWWD
jgi:protein ImuB